MDAFKLLWLFTTTVILEYSYHIKAKFMRLTMGDLSSKDLFPYWKCTRPTQSCHLCGYKEEAFIHILCICLILMGACRYFLRKHFNTLQIRSCRAALIQRLSGNNPQLSCNFVKIIDICAMMPQHLLVLTV